MENKADTREITVSDEFRGQRLDKFLTLAVNDLSRNKISNLISSGKVLVNGKNKKSSFILHGSENVKIEFDNNIDELQPYKFDLNIVYEDSQIIVINKPSGLTTHPPNPGYNETVVNVLIGMGKTLKGGSDVLRPGVVHRLDKETSGLMVLAKTDHSYESLVSQFKERSVIKVYQAICHGVINENNIKVDLPVSRDKTNRLKMRVSFSNAKNAETEVFVLRRFKNAMLVKVKIFTGRMHQIRVHMNFLGCPILGDKKYGRRDNYKSLMLHAVSLSFVHPTKNEKMEFISELPERFQAFIKQNS
jgi:23S rRNA pseudouridine1911/1915/1917 synthase